MGKVLRISIVVICVLLASCALRRAVVEPPSARQETIAAIKRVEQEVGFESTGNFHGADARRDAFYRCYFTGKLKLPSSYEDLRIKEGTASGCEVDESEYDLFFYKIEAVAGADVGVTEALEETTVERLAVVVAHEDFHEDPQVQRLPTRIGEAATTLVGFLTAARFAAKEYGESSAEFRNLDREADLYLRKALLVNSYHHRLSELFEAVRKEAIGRPEALDRKQALYDEMQNTCEEIEPEPTSFNKWLAANNNAGLGFEMTYTAYYPLAYKLHESGGGNLHQTITVLRQAGEFGTSSEEKTVRFLEQRVENAIAIRTQ